MSGISFYNSSGETIPAYGCMKPTGSSVIEGQAVLTMGKPDAEWSRTYYLNGPVDVPAGSYGVAQDAARFPAIAIFAELSSGDPAIDEHWGPTLDDWRLQQGMEGFVILGHPFGDVPEESDDKPRRVVVQPYEIRTLIARLTENLDDPTRSAPADVQRIAGLTLGADFNADADTNLEYTDSGILCRVFGGRFLGASVALDTGTYVTAEQIFHGNRLQIVATDVCGITELDTSS
jgi:hypothetical protein